MNPAGQRPAQAKLVLLGPADGSGGSEPPPADPGLFTEAVAAFRARIPMTDDEYTALTAVARTRAFTIAGVAQVDVLNDVWAEIDKAVEKGTTLADFKKAVGDKLDKAWGGANPPRVENIFRTNVQGAYGAGRIKQLRAPAVMKARPYWKFSAVLDGRTSPICRPLNGTVLAADDPWWGSHQPPLHFMCRSAVIPLTGRQARDTGIAEEAPDVEAQDGFGNVEDFEQWTPAPGQYPRPLRAALEKK